LKLKKMMSITLILLHTLPALFTHGKARDFHCDDSCLVLSS
jgi:hypothetical protein